MGAHDQRRSGNCAQAKQARDRSESCTNTATEAHKDPVLADRHLCYICAAVPRWTCRPPRLQQPLCAIQCWQTGGRGARPNWPLPRRQLCMHVVLQCSRSQLPRSGHDDRRRAPARILKQGTGTIRARQGGCLQGAHTRLGAQGECSGGGSGSYLFVDRRPGSRSAAELGRVEVALAAPAPLA